MDIAKRSSGCSLSKWVYKEKIASLLDGEDRKRLKAIYEPVVIGVMPEDARRGLCVMPDGEIRSYGIYDKIHLWDAEGAKGCYLSSYNGGLDWRFRTTVPGCLGAASRDPDTGRWMTVKAVKDEGTYCFLSDIGPDDTEFKRVKITDLILGDEFQPVKMKSGRWFCTAHHTERPGNDMHPVFMYSDDNGESWTTKVFPSTPKHSPVWPDLQHRWQNNGSEPSAAELPDGRLMMVARTSLDHLFVYYSQDGGESWTDGVESDFCCTTTTPYLLALEDGRTLLFWNNARPLSERRRDFVEPPLSDVEIAGLLEDVFTNRDVNHCAVTENGRDWFGVRELFLSAIRNEADYRSKGGRYSSADKSVHQFQALELPYNKILVEFGQHQVSRKMVIFDVNWLYEKERHEDFELGLEHISNHMFVKSVSGCHFDTLPGHCAWNRVPGALLMPSPDRDYSEVLQIGRVHDKRLYCEKQGAVWAFPSAQKGRVNIRMMVLGAGLRISLCGVWLNPCEEYASEFAAFHCDLDGRCVEKNIWHNIIIEFDCTARRAVVYDGEKCLFSLRMTAEAPLGLMYLHMQTLAEEEDFDGTCVKRMDFEAL
ncbi:MAG: exo-alpha-sialidase [Clostridia bacterium]|nr:exo-alpha-sialidase [Clostridia bacterium]